MRPVRVAALLLVLLALALSSQLALTRTWTASGAAAGPGGTPDFAGNPPANRDCGSCHGSDEAGTVKVLQADLSPIPTTYTPGKTYNWIVEVENLNNTFKRWGYDLTIMWDTNDAAYVDRTAGSLAPGDAYSNLKDGITFSPAGPDPRRQFLTHYGIRKGDTHVDGTYGGQLNRARWPFKWVAPFATGYAVKVYVTGVAADNDSTAPTDPAYKTTYTLTEADVPTAAHPTTWGKIKKSYR